MNFPHTREAAVSRLHDFIPDVARYQEHRGFDTGNGEQDSVSRLSPYIRTRLVTEEECSRAVLENHSPQAAGKYLQEIAWRTYWKGWLEMRPEVWDHYLASLEPLDESPDYLEAIEGRTGIACFDHWVNELKETGYLHNHARMWFASIWIFTLRLPWQLGAAFFMKLLLDADPASNTLSWRWVAGLHTKGKHYLARASNIEKYTQGRFNPIGQLNETAEPIPLDREFERKALILPEDPKAEGRIGHLMFPEDLAPPPDSVGKIQATAAYLTPILKTTLPVSSFLEGAVEDTLKRNGGSRLRGELSEALGDWIDAEKLDAVTVSFPTVGPTRDFLESLDLPIELKPFVREWDRRLWPKATAGFFKFRKTLPDLHRTLTSASQKISS